MSRKDKHHISWSDVDRWVKHYMDINRNVVRGLAVNKDDVDKCRGIILSAINEKGKDFLGEDDFWYDSVVRATTKTILDEYGYLLREEPLEARAKILEAERITKFEAEKRPKVETIQAKYGRRIRYTKGEKTFIMVRYNKQKKKDINKILTQYNKFALKYHHPLRSYNGIRSIIYRNKKR